MTVLDLCHRNFPALHVDDTVERALATFRREGLPHKVIYVYVVDTERRLVGVVPVRQLLMADPKRRVGELLVPNVVALAASTGVEEARRAFAEHRFLAFPVVDAERRLVGVIDIEKFAVDLGAVHERTSFDDVYELLGLHDAVGRSAWANARMRMPWLATTVLAGLAGAFLVAAFEATLAQTLVLAFFLMMVLGLNEAAAMQAATLAVQRFHRLEPGWRAYRELVGKELRTAVLLGIGCAAIVAGVSFAWKGQLAVSLAMGASLVASVAVSCVWGLTVPFILRRMRADAKVAAGPVALALADLTTLIAYFGSAALAVR